MPEELWMEAHDIVQEAVIKTIPKKKKCKKAKWLSGKDLKIAEEKREAKGRGEKERYTHVNAKFQRIARRDNKGPKDREAHGSLTPASTEMLIPASATRAL